MSELTEQQQKNVKTNKIVLKVLGGIMAVILLLAVLGSCLGGSEKSPEATSGAVSSPASTPEPSDGSIPVEADFAVGWGKVDGKTDMTVQQARNNAYMVCLRLEQKQKPKTILADVTSNATGSEAAGLFIYNYATDNLCPNEVK